MSDALKVFGTFIGVIGAAAIIYQLNQGTLFQSAAGTFQNSIGAAFSPSPNSSSKTTATNKPRGNRAFTAS